MRRGLSAKFRFLASYCMHGCLISAQWHWQPVPRLVQQQMDGGRSIDLHVLRQIPPGAKCACRDAVQATGGLVPEQQFSSGQHPPFPWREDLEI